jgi:putative tricarboxylic transport membrane protein
MLIADLCNLAVGPVGLRFRALVSAPKTVIYPAALLLCVTGVYMSAEGVMGLVVMVAAAVLGHVMRLLGLSIIAFIVAFVLARQLESALLNTMLIIGGDMTQILDHTIALAFLALSVVSVIWLGPRRGRGAPADAAPGRG